MHDGKLVTILFLQAQVGKEMKAFRNKDGITVTIFKPAALAFTNKVTCPTRGRL